MTVGNSEVGTSESQEAPAERSAPLGGQDSRKSEVTQRDPRRGLRTAVVAYCTPPSVLRDPPASIGELRAYVRTGPWTSKNSRLRALALVWHRLVSVPTTLSCRYVEWISQRFGRSLAVYLLWKLIIRTGPGPWVADHIIRPAFGFAGWLFL